MPFHQNLRFDISPNVSKIRVIFIVGLKLKNVGDKQLFEIGPPMLLLNGDEPSPERYLSSFYER